MKCIKIISRIIIFCLFINNIAYAGNMNVKLEKIYPTGNKILVSYNEGKQSLILALPMQVSGNVEVPPKINISKVFKVGNSYPASYIDDAKTKVYLYDDSGQPHIFIDDTAARKYITAMKLQKAKYAAYKPPPTDPIAEVGFIVVIATLLGIAFWALGQAFAAEAS